MEKKTKRVFSEEFKIETMKLITEKGRSVGQVSRDLEIGENVLRRWKQKYVQGSVLRLPTATELLAQEELKSLRKDKERLQMEREILKKTIGILSRGELWKNIN